MWSPVQRSWPSVLLPCPSKISKSWFLIIFWYDIRWEPMNPTPGPGSFLQKTHHREIALDVCITPALRIKNIFMKNSNWSKSKLDSFETNRSILPLKPMLNDWRARHRCKIDMNKKPADGPWRLSPKVSPCLSTQSYLNFGNHNLIKWAISTETSFTLHGRHIHQLTTLESGVTWQSPKYSSNYTKNL